MIATLFQLDDRAPYGSWYSLISSNTFRSTELACVCTNLLPNPLTCPSCSLHHPANDPQPRAPMHHKLTPYCPCATSPVTCVSDKMTPKLREILDSATKMLGSACIMVGQKMVSDPVQMMRSQIREHFGLHDAAMASRCLQSRIWGCFGPNVFLSCQESVEQCPGEILNTICRNPSVSKPSFNEFNIFYFFYRFFPLKWWSIYLESQTCAGQLLVSARRCRSVTVPRIRHTDYVTGMWSQTYNTLWCQGWSLEDHD